MEEFGRFLCKIGLHRWKYIAMSLFGDRAYMCKRPYCRTCKQEFLAGATTYWQRTEVLAGDKQ